MIYITGDTHGRFDRIVEFCEENETSTEDTMIILGDAGINFDLGLRDEILKRQLARFPITLFCIHGNHEERPYEIDSYEEMPWRGGIVYAEQEYPNLLFAKDGEIYDLGGRKVVVIGGAYSIDKFYRITGGLPWFPTEQPDEVIKSYVESQLEKANWRVDDVLTHTAPLKHEPRWAFLPNINQGLVDKTTELWLDTIEDRLTYSNWYCGHYHVDGYQGTVKIMYEEIEEFI